MRENKNLQFKDLGKNDKVPYTKVDISKSSAISGNFALSFYQFDYNGIATSLSMGKQELDHSHYLIPVAKVVMDNQSFKQLYNEMKMLLETIDKRLKEMGNQE